jgi:hypothetical protein
VTKKTAIIWDTTPRSQFLTPSSCLVYSYTLKMAPFSEASVDLYRNAERHIAEDSSLHSIHSSPQTQTHTDLWNSAMGDSLQFQHRNPTALSIQDSPSHSERTLVHKQPQDPWRSTSEHSGQWNSKAEYQILKKIRKPHQCTSSEPTRQ